MNNRIIFLFYFLIIGVSNQFSAQLNWGIEVAPKFGFLIGQRGEIANIPRSHTLASEISYVIYTNGQKKWHKTYGFPNIGVTLFNASVGNREILGNFSGSYGFIDLPLLKTKRFQLCAKLGSGLAYTSKVYDPIINPKNAVISAHVNALVCFGLKNKFMINPNQQLILGVDLTHCSNGAFKVPNIGINMPFLSLGYSYRFKTTDYNQEEEKKLIFNKFYYGVTGILSSKEIFPTGQGSSMIYGLSLFTRRFVQPKAGIEFSMDIISKQSILKYKPEIQKTQTDLIQVGLFSGYLLPLDRFHLIIGMGMNVFDKFQPESFLYHKIGMRYYFDNGIHLNAVLRSNWAKADFAEWGIGYTLNYTTK
jgi:hypothetical protein